VDNTPPSVSPSFSWRALLQLLRLPNVFTAFADVLLGYLITHESIGDGIALSLLLASSGCLYLAGMALNDVFDREIDAIERPQRPIPSGRIPLRIASRCGWGLLAAGVVGAAVVDFRETQGAMFPGTLLIGGTLAVMVVAYDGYLKRTPLGPIAMGGCRALNVMLGMSAAPLDVWHPMHLWIAGGLGVYVAGLTWFARQEATTSRRPHLALAAIVMLGALAALSQYPRSADELLPTFMQPNYAIAETWRWHALWLASGALIGHRLVRAILSPTPRHVQLAVKSSILAIVVLDAICCLGVCGPTPALMMLLLLGPALWLGRWIYST
jgi:hypothetical protein